LGGNLDGGKSSGLFETSDGNFYGFDWTAALRIESIQLVIVKKPSTTRLCRVRPSERFPRQGFGDIP